MLHSPHHRMSGAPCKEAPTLKMSCADGQVNKKEKLLSKASIALEMAVQEAASDKTWLTKLHEEEAAMTRKVISFQKQVCDARRLYGRCAWTCHSRLC